MSIHGISRISFASVAMLFTLSCALEQEDFQDDCSSGTCDIEDNEQILFDRIHCNFPADEYVIVCRMPKEGSWPGGILESEIEENADGHSAMDSNGIFLYELGTLEFSPFTTREEFDALKSSPIKPILTSDSSGNQYYQWSHDLRANRYKKESNLSIKWRFSIPLSVGETSATMNIEGFTVLDIKQNKTRLKVPLGPELAWQELTIGPKSETITRGQPFEMRYPFNEKKRINNKGEYYRATFGKEKDDKGALRLKLPTDKTDNSLNQVVLPVLSKANLAKSDTMLELRLLEKMDDEKSEDSKDFDQIKKSTSFVLFGPTDIKQIAPKK